jgi:type IV secretion system protein VirB3
MMSKPVVYSSYGALARPAMFFGVPVSAFGIVFIASTILTLLGFLLFGGKGLLILLLPVPILLLFRTLCANDDQALSVIGFEIMCFFRKRNGKFFNKTFTIAADKKENLQDYVGFFRRHHKKQERTS